MKVNRLSIPAALVLASALTVGVRSQEPGRREPPPGGRGGGMARVNPVLQALDADGDGELSAAEVANASAALLTLDRDKNGRLTADELRPAFDRAGGNAGELVTRLLASDKNGDGKLSADELPDRMRSLMERADTNKDGFIDRAELTRLAEQPSRRGPGSGEAGPRTP